MPILGALKSGPGGGGDDGVVDPGSGGGGSGEGPVVAGITALTLTTADGRTTYELTNPEAFLAILGRKGFYAPQYDVYTDESPMVDGETFRAARALPRDITLPVYIRGNDRPEFLTRVRTFLAKLSPQKGMVTLEVAEADGSRRRIRAYFQGRGGEGDGTRQMMGRTWVKLPLELRCPDPYWLGDPLHVEFDPPNVGKWFGTTTFFPFQVQSTQSFGVARFTNPGDVSSFPVWKITGPTTGGVVLKRLTPGLPEKTLTFSTTLTAGQHLLVDTRPEAMTITDHTGANRWADLATGSSFWRINPGENVVEVAVGGATSATLVELNAEPRYETA